MNENVFGRRVINALAEEYPQLYLDLGDEDGYAAAVKRGQFPQERTVKGFVTDERDSCVMEPTPAGKVRVVTLYHRVDFERFYRIMGCKCRSTPIPPTMGASIIDGVANWSRIRAHKEEFFAAETAAGRFPDWGAEFRRFVSVRENYLDAIIVLSTGFYSNIPPERLGLGAEKWRELSLIIRRTHECTHFICRRKYPALKDPVWDEIVADAAGITAALGRFDPETEKVFLGISKEGYTGGRLENYELTQPIDEAAARICEVLDGISRLYEQNPGITPFGFAELLEQNKEQLWHK